MATYPHEVVRTRLRETPKTVMENNKLVTRSPYNGLINTFVRIAREEGTRGLYAGMGAHLMRVVPNTAIMFACYELIVKMFQDSQKS